MPTLQELINQAGLSPERVRTLSTQFKPEEIQSLSNAATQLPNRRAGSLHGFLSGAGLSDPRVKEALGFYSPEEIQRQDALFASFVGTMPLQDDRVFNVPPNLPGSGETQLGPTNLAAPVSSPQPRTVFAPPSAQTLAPLPPFQPLVDQGFRDLVRQFSEQTNTLGQTELNRQVQENFLPLLKTTAAASGQVSNEGVVSGPFLENLNRLSADVGREAGNIALRASTTGFDKTIAGLTEDARGRLEQTRLELQRGVAQGQIGVQQAEIAMRGQIAQEENRLREQQLRLQTLDLLTGRQLQASELGIRTIESGQDRQLRELLALSGLGGVDIDTAIRALGALNRGGATQTTSQSGSVLGDLLGLAGAGGGLLSGLGAAGFRFSSRRFKEHIGSIPDPLNTVLRLRGRAFDWKHSGAHDLGLIAEEVAEVLPDMVVYEPGDTEALGVNYQAMVPLLVEAMREQQEQIEGLRSRLNDQERAKRGGGHADQ